MDEEVKQLLNRAVRDLLSLEVTLFFHTHPEQVDSPEGLCRWLACEPAPLAQILQNLTRAGILDYFRLGDGRYEVYSYTHNPEIRATIEKLNISYHDDPSARLEIIKHLISHLPQMKAAHEQPGA